MKILKFVIKFLIVSCLSISGLLIVVVFIIMNFSQLKSWYTGEPIQKSLNGFRCLHIEDEFEYFHESSEIMMPLDANIILSCDDHGGFHWEGEYYIVFSTSNENISSYLDVSLWDLSWSKGPVPEDIRHTALADNFSDIFESSEIFYVVQGHHQFYNGRLMVIDPSQSKVFYSQWDF